MTTQHDFFTPIGQVVQTVDAADLVPADTTTTTAQVPDATSTSDGFSVEDPQVVDNIDSLCMNCEEQGVTRLFLTRIPFFREVVLMSFECPHCSYRNSEIQSAGKIQERGCRYTFKITAKSDLNRQIVKSDTCTCRFRELDLEIPAQRGHLTTIEGLLSTVAEDLETDQPARRALDPDSAEKIDAFVARIRSCLDADPAHMPLHLDIDDPAGNSWIEPGVQEPRGKWSRTDYLRSPVQNEALGLTNTDIYTNAADADGDSNMPDNNHPATDDTIVNGRVSKDEVHTFPATCPSCTRPCSTHMKFVDIPHFAEVVLMSTVCDDCGYKSNEVKTGGAVPAKGIRITLNVTDPDDLARDILKSETCALNIPELNLDLTPGTLGGRFTTLEGLLAQVHDDLRSRIFGGMSDDSVDADSRERWKKFFEGLAEAKEGKRTFTLVMEDPLGASYVQNLYAPDKDPEMTVEEYERTEEQEEELGLRDMKTEGYEATTT